MAKKTTKKKATKKEVVRKSVKRKVISRGRPKKAVKYTKTINVRLTQAQWVEVLSWAQKANLEVSVYIRKILLDFLNIQHDILPHKGSK